SKPERFVKGSGSIIRKAMQQLENAGFVKTTPKGREISSQGRSLLDNNAYELAQNA
ncbi:MAG: 40S ribosomal protein S19, partial [Halobacteriota archaeon]